MHRSHSDHKAAATFAVAPGTFAVNGVAAAPDAAAGRTYFSSGREKWYALMRRPVLK